MTKITRDDVVDSVREIYTEIKMLADKIEQTRRKFDDFAKTTPSALDLCHIYNATYETSDFIAEVLDKPLSGINLYLANTAIIEAFERDGVPNVSLTNPGVRFSASTRTSASLVDKVAGMAWLQENGHGALIQPTVNSSSLASFAKNYTLETGMDLPSDVIKVSQMRYVSRTKL